MTATAHDSDGLDVSTIFVDTVCTLAHFSDSVLGEYSMRVDIVCAQSVGC